MRAVINKTWFKAGFLSLVILIFSLDITRGSEVPGVSVRTKGMVKIPGGTYTKFLVDQDKKTVTVKPFLLDTRAVTNQEFLVFVKANPKWARSKVAKLFADGGYLKHWKDDFTFPEELKNSPVTNVSLHAANAYSKWKGKRLPTLAEWEYVGNGRILNEKLPVDKVILNWYSKPTPKVLPAVNSTYQNEFKVYDMHGLIWEWVADFNSVIMESDSRSSSAVNRELFCASGSSSAIDKKNYAAFMRFAYRSSLKANYTVNNLGFRCAADIK